MDTFVLKKTQCRQASAKVFSVIIKVLVISVPTYSVAYLTEAMVYTIPTLAVCSMIAMEFNKPEKRIEEDIDIEE